MTITDENVYETKQTNQTKQTKQTKKINKNQEIILDDMDVYFNEAIITRGKALYAKGKVLKVIKVNNTFYANVESSDGSTSYFEEIKIKDNRIIESHCSCPCDFKCKHVYAALIAISRGEYKNLGGYDDELNELDDDKFLELVPNDKLVKTTKDIIARGGIVTSEILKLIFKCYDNRDYVKYIKNRFNNLLLARNNIDSYWLLNARIDEFKDEIFNLIRDCNENELYDKALKLSFAFINATCKNININIDRKLDYKMCFYFIDVAITLGGNKVKKIFDEEIKKIEDEKYYNIPSLKYEIIKIKK